MLRPRWLIFILAVFLYGSAVHAVTYSINDIGISYVLGIDGSADVTELWDIEADATGEWTISKRGLWDSKIINLTLEEDGIQQVCDSITAYSGMVIRWSINSPGRHLYTLRYRILDAVNSLEDYDMLYLHFIPFELPSAVKHASIEISAKSADITADNAMVWCVERVGTTAMNDGAIMFEAADGLPCGESVTLLARLDKGIIPMPSSVWEGEYFQTILDDVMVDPNSFTKPRTLCDKSVSGFDELLIFLFEALLVFLTPPLCRFIKNTTRESWEQDKERIRQIIRIFRK